MCDFYFIQKTNKSRKKRICECCNSEIKENESYQRHTGKYNGNFFSFIICPACSKILDYYTLDLGHDEFNINELISELMFDEKVLNWLKEIKNPSEYVKSIFEEYEERKLENDNE